MWETEHIRNRRAERGIDKKDCKTAMKKGEELQCKYGRKYKYKGLYYVVDWKRKKELSCYAESLRLKKVKITTKMMTEIAVAKERLKNDPKAWKSNSVLVVDTSGSMRESDVWGARTRLNAVWMCIALDFIAQRIESGNGGLYDVISVVLLGKTERVLIKAEPTSWKLFNRIVEIYNNQQVRAKDHGFYVPSLERAEKILTRNRSSSCALALCFLSDGRPSDRGSARDGIIERVESLGTRFGRRLTFTAIGIGSDPDEFQMLNKMVDTAKDYGVQSFFMLPSMTTSSLGVSLTSTATTLTKTQTEMTDLSSMKQRYVRNKLRESRRRANEEVVSFVSPEEYWIYPISKVERKIYREWHDESRKRRHSYDVSPMMEGDRTHFVALNKKVFGEGAERYAFRFFEIGEDGTSVVSKPLVAKESRLVLDGEEEGREMFVRTFCQTQQLARRIAEEFNQKLDSLYRVDKATPRVSFLDCSIYELDDNDLGKQSVLVEEKINHEKWHKWNMNNGYIEGMDEAPEFNHEKMRSALNHLADIEIEDDYNDADGFVSALDAIVEGDEEESEDDEKLSTSSVASNYRGVKAITFSASEVAQAFSHFSYLATGKKRLICDLQGVFDGSSNTLKFTDPVIHYFNYRRQRRKNVHGRTDRGRKGMAMFFATHKECCGHLCRLVTGGFKKKAGRNKTDDKFPGRECVKCP